MTLAIDVRGVTKKFRLPLDKSSTLKHRVTHWRSSGRYRALLALNEVSFSIKTGEFVGVIGDNGCGKSTLLKILAGIYPANGGEVRISGKISSFLELGVGFNPELTARENIHVNGAILGLSRKELHRLEPEIFEFSELQEFSDQKIKNFSSGMEVRLAFAIAIQAHADVLLMDEVLAVGDSRFQAKCFRVFASYKREGKTVVLVTHDMDAVTAYCDRAIVIADGRIDFDGPAALAVAHYRESSDRVPLSADTPMADDADTADGWGSREASITGVTFLDSQGAPQSRFRFGDRVRVRMTIRARTYIDDLVCAFFFHTEMGSVVTVPTSQKAPISVVSQPEQEIMVDYEIPRLALLGGSYLVGAEIARRGTGRPIHRQDLRYRFAVLDDQRREGLLDLGGNWSVSAADGPDQ